MFDLEGALDINLATEAELRELPTLGSKRADAIVAFRKANWKFASIDALDDVPGIGPATISAIREFIVAVP